MSSDSLAEGGRQTQGEGEQQAGDGDDGGRFGPAPEAPATFAPTAALLNPSP